MTAVNFPDNPQPGDVFLNFAWDGEKWRNAGGRASAVVLKDLFEFSVAADDSTQRTISTGESIKFTGAGTVSTSSNAEGNITITGAATNLTGYATETYVTTRGYLTSTSSLVNGARTVSLGADGALTIPGDIRSDSNINIDINLADSTLRRWQFGEDGDTVFPNNVSINYSGNNIQFPRIIADSGKAFSVQGQGTSGSAALSWTVDPDAAGQYAAVAVSKGGGDNLAKVVIQAQSNSGDAATAKTWRFDETGALTIPGDIRSEGNINIEINLADSTMRRWQFGEDGELTLPAGGNISEGSIPGGTLTGNTIVLTPNGGTSATQQLLVYPTTGPDANHLHLTSGDLTTTELFLGNDDQYVKLASDGNVSIQADDGLFTAAAWTFGFNGLLTFPDGTTQSTAPAITISADDSTQRTVYLGEESIKFIGAGTVTTASDADGNITITGTGGGTSIPAVVTTGAVGTGGAGHVKVQFTVTSATTVTAVGVTVIGVTDSTKGRITLSGSPGTGSFDIAAMPAFSANPAEFFICMPFATNASGTGYGAPILGEGTNPCYVRGTMITMADMSRVAVENITYHDDILVWDFDLGEFASAKPIWIKKTQTAVVSCLLTFSDDSELRIVGDSPKAHRIFNKEAGKFTYGSMPETPIGTTTFNDQGEEITLISKEWIVGEVEFYNVMTDYHMNLFANSILTSMRYNNVYPITDMKFVKDSRTLRTADDYPNIEERLYRGFRLAEQTQSVEEIETHIQWLLSLEVERETESV